MFKLSTKPAFCQTLVIGSTGCKTKIMATFETVDVGTIALIQQTEEGRILQIGLTPNQSEMLQSFLAVISKESKLIQMPEEYDLVLKSSLKTKR